MDWNKLSEKRKKEISKSKPVFIIGSRELSKAKIKKIKFSLSKSKILWGILKNRYILDFEDCPQFETMKKEDLLDSLDNQIEILEYFQRDLKYILKELDFSAVIFVNASWSKMLHIREEFWCVLNKKIPYKLVSPFVDEKEAKKYFDKKNKKLKEKSKIISFEFASWEVGSHRTKSKKLSDLEFMKVVDQVAKMSFDHVKQIGAVLVKEDVVLAYAHNKIVPFETYAMHYGSVREKNFAPINDQNYYDTNHAEVELLLYALKNKLDLKGSSLYINVLPCPFCTKMILGTDISEIVYKEDHSDGYGYDMLIKGGKKVRRI